MNNRFLTNSLSSSTTTTTTSSAATTITTSNKKKFGKNLNKLMKQPTPPPINGLNSKTIYKLSTSSSTTSGTSSLVLLSTKKKKSAITSNGFSSGSSSSVSLRNKGNANIYESVTTTVTDVNDLNGTKHDAWGKEKTNHNQNGEQIQYKQEEINTIIEEKSNGTNINDDNINRKQKQSLTSLDDDPQQHHHQSTTSPSPSDQKVMQYDQVEFMKQLAKEKAAKMRQEEENRILQQKERAALRLKELEMKMAAQNQQQPQVVEQEKQQQQLLQQKRALFDPSSSSSSSPPPRSYSSFDKNNNDGTASGSNTTRVGNHFNTNDQQLHSNPPPPPPPPPSSSDKIITMPMYHLTSYEDRDRGMIRNRNTGPRMLFDPKSGSMVAAPTKEDNNSTANDRDRTNSGSNDRERKGSSKGSIRREKGKSKGSSKNNKKDLNSGGSSTVDSDCLDGKGKKLRNKSIKKDKRKDDKQDNTASPNGRKKNNTSSSSERHDVKNKVSLPRTKGVLYKRDDHGNLVSADGCDGDQGYGAHTVPGGRIRNPKGYDTHKRKLLSESKLFANNLDNYSNQGIRQWNQYYDYSWSHMDSEYDSTRPKALNRSHFLRKVTSSNQPPSLSKEEEFNHDIPSPLRVKGDDKLELLTGMDESPTLQATAAAWAPSQAALAIAAANASKKSTENPIQNNDTLTDSEAAVCVTLPLVDERTTSDDDHDYEDGNDGLGFDPTTDMDAVIMSPDFFSTEITESDLKSIPDLLFNKFNKVSSKNPFASDSFLGPSPWGTNGVHHSVSAGALSDWAYPVGSGKKDGASEFSSGNVISDDMRANSVLSLSGLNGDKNTWGTSGLKSKFNVIDSNTFGNDNHKSSG